MKTFRFVLLLKPSKANSNSLKIRNGIGIVWAVAPAVGMAEIEARKHIIIDGQWEIIKLEGSGRVTVLSDYDQRPEGLHWFLMAQANGVASCIAEADAD
jgi:hypothetical protein